MADAQVILNIPEAYVSRVLDAFENYAAIPDDPENPGTPLYTRAQWAKLLLKYYVMNMIRTTEQRDAGDTAQQTISVTIDDLVFSKNKWKLTDEKAKEIALTIQIAKDNIDVPDEIIG